MRRSASFFAAALGFACASAATLPARAQGVVVATDQAERLHLRGAAADVVIANPEVAEVALIDPRTLVITGKAPGRTTLVVFDRARRVLFDGPVSVGVRAGYVTMVRGGGEGAAEERVYTCSGVCTARAAK